MTEAAHPRLSVVVAFREAPDALERVLAALRAQIPDEDVEVIVAHGSDRGTATLQETYPWLRVLRRPGAILPVLKGDAIQAARAPVVAILDPADVPEPGWVAAILEGFGPDRAEAVRAIGGAVLPGGTPSGANRAAYLFEYGAFNPPVTAGPTEADLPGNNVAYRREALVVDCGDVLAEEGFNKPFCHERIRELGGVLEIRPQMRVRHETRYGFFAFAARRFHYGRCFGATRCRRSTSRRRWLYRVFAPAVPVLLVTRHLARALAGRSNRRLLPAAALPLVGICLSWGVGECLGYWFGPGRSCRMFY